jgi:hypothetical protein
MKTKKADVAEHPEVFDHVGLLVNEPLQSCWGCSSPSHPKTIVTEVAILISPFPDSSIVAFETDRASGFFFGFEIN